MTQETLPISDWIKIARKDWERISLFFQAEDFDGAGFFLQQALEKYLKAWLLQQGWALEKIHQLHTLLDAAMDYDPSLSRFEKVCERVSSYYFDQRYPPFGKAGLRKEILQENIKAARELIQGLFPGEELK
jgi:HEPN domain-containing protein